MANLPNLWSRGHDPLNALRREMSDLFGDFGRRWPTFTEIGARMPAVNVAEGKDAFEVTAELPGVDEKDIQVTIDGNRVVIAGEKKQESEKDDKDWHIVERSYGSFHRAVALPFEPKSEAVSAHFDKGVLHLSIAKPVATTPAAQKIEIKTGAPPVADKA